MESRLVKEFARTAGASLCGIAGVERFAGAPRGFNPKDVFSLCRSVVVFVKQMPLDVILAENPVPYTHAAYKMYEQMDRIGMDLCGFFQANGVKAVPVPSDTPYLSWDAENMHGMGIISLKHAAVLSGLGIMGKNTLLINRELGNMVYVGAVLTDADMEEDSITGDFACPPSCRRCIDSCPQHAIGDMAVDQKLCRQASFIKHERGWDLYSCNRCRRVCPMRVGL